MKPPRRRVVTGKQPGNSLTGYTYEWICILSCGHEARHNVMYKNVPKPKKLQCFICARAAKTVDFLFTGNVT